MKLTSIPRVIRLVRAFLAFAVLLGSGISSVGAQGHVSASATANATATIIQGLQINKNSNLRFGALLPGGAGGTVTVDVNGNRTATGSITLITSSSFPVTAATFTLQGQPNLAYSITLPTTAILTLQGGSATVVVSSFVSSPSATGTLDAGGNGTLNVGATLTVPAAQTAGYYLGQFTVTLTYQ